MHLYNWSRCLQSGWWVGGELSHSGISIVSLTPTSQHYTEEQQHNNIQQQLHIMQSYNNQFKCFNELFCYKLKFNHAAEHFYTDRKNV